MTTIEKIHHEFDTAQDRLLEQAKQIIDRTKIESETPEEIISERLKWVGFTQTPTVRKADRIKARKEKQKTILVESVEQANLIQYYQNTYPFLKFLTESELDRICKKWNLVYAPIANYIRDVPEKNLRDIEMAKPLRPMDEAKNFFKYEFAFYPEVPQQVRKWLKELRTYKQESGDEYFRELCPYKYNGDYLYKSGGLKIIEIYRSGLFIAAPKSHFNTKGLTQTGLGFFKIFITEVKDPIVFRYVKGGIQVLTKWGEEASDPSLVVPKLN